jgi:hypothetical protein
VELYFHAEIARGLKQLFGLRPLARDEPTCHIGLRLRPMAQNSKHLVDESIFKKSVGYGLPKI